MDLSFLSPYPQKLNATKKTFPMPKKVSIKAPARARDTERMLKEDIRRLAKISISAKAAFKIRLKLTDAVRKPEGYKLRLDEKGVEVTARDQAGLYYGTQTLLQLLVLPKTRELPKVRIDDWPRYKLRSFMVDMGRAPYRMALLKRVVRILARLKMNVLHVHVNDDQLCSLRFKKLPLGSENPEAITIAQLKQLVQYARKYHVTIMPEIECWGHAASVIYHYPELYGAPGMWGGMSFGIGEETFELFGRMFDEVVPALEKDCLIHVGLDEAKWALLKSVPPNREKAYSPSKLVGSLHSLLEEAGAKHKRDITMHLWADHGGRPLPKPLKKRVVVEPWMYFEAREDDIRRKVRKFGGKNKTPFMMGGGMSSAHFTGHFGATRLWCREGDKYPNVEGITICLWETNNVSGHLLGLYGGADAAWSPFTQTLERNKKHCTGEYIRGQVYVRMRDWQAKFKDGDTEAIDADRGPEVYKGYYCWGEKAGQPVAPTVEHRPPGQNPADQ